MAVAQLLKPITDEIADEYLLRLPNPPGGKHDIIVIWLGYLIMPYAIDLGMLTASQAGYRMSGGNLRVPDFAFTHYDRFSNREVPDGFIEFAPDLAAEIISRPKNPATWRVK